MNKLKFLLISTLLFTGACSAGAPGGNGGIAGAASEQAAPRNGGDMSVSKSAADPAAAMPQDVSLDEAGKSQQQPTERKIIRNAELNLEAASPEEVLQKITALAEGKGGFVVESQQSNSTAQATVSDRVTVTLRVPAEKFGETIGEIRQLATRVITENIKGQDVTEEFIDIEARVKTKKALEAQYLEIMKQGKTVGDALDVQQKLADVRGEIEKIEGRKRFLESQASLSTIKVTLQTPTAFSANSSGFFYQAGKSFGSGFTFALNFILGFFTIIIALTPFLLLVVLPLYLLARYFWKKRRKKILAAKFAQEEKTQ